MSSVPNVIHFNCQSCGMLLTVPKELAGVTGPCPHCRATITSPAAPSPAAQVPGPSWPMAQNAAIAPPTPAAASAPARVNEAAAPSPARTQLPPPQSARSSSPAPRSPESAWEASNPPQASPLPPAVGGGLLNPAWPPAGTELPPPALPSSGSAHPVMESVLQMPGVHQAAGVAGQTVYPASPAFPPSPPPRTSPLAPPNNGGAAAQRFKSSRRSSSSRKGPAILALLMALMAIAGTAWFFRDQIRAAWSTHLANRAAAAEALEFHPTSENATTPTAPPSGNDNSPKNQPSSLGSTAGPAKDGGAPDQETPPSGKSATTPEPGEQTRRPEMTARTPDPAPAPAPASSPNPALPSGVLAPPPQPPPPAPAPNLVEVPSPAPPSAESIPSAAAVSPKGTTAPAPAQPAPPSVVDVTEEALPALESLKQFLAAPTWEERLSVVQGAEVMKPLMQSYYASMPDGPLHVSKIGLIRHDKAPQTGPPQCVFQIGGADLKRPLPIMVEQSRDGWKVDWLTFIEFKDNLLARFMESPQEGPKRFHVLVRRTHYFDDNVPALDKKICVEVQAPMPPFVGSVFANKGTQVAHILDRYLGWEVDQAAAVVQLEWRKEGDQQWVELTDLPQFNWRNALAGEVTPPPQVPPTTPVAVPARD